MTMHARIARNVGVASILTLVAAATSFCHEPTAPFDARDARPIVFMTLSFPGGWQIGQADARSQVASLVPTNVPDAQFPALDRTGTRIAFIAPGPGALYVANADGTNATMISPRGGTRVSWSPDGTQLAVAQNEYSYPGPQFFKDAVHIVTIATGRVDTLRLSSGLRPGAATWSPDGKRLLVEVRDTVAGSGLVSVALDGSDEHVVIPSTHSLNDWVRDGIYSPDGKRIAFAKLVQGVSAIWVANADGTGAYALTHDGGYFDLRPAWSPSGRLIAYSHNYNCGCSRSGYDIFVTALGDAPPWPVTAGLSWGGTQPSW